MILVLGEAARRIRGLQIICLCAHRAFIRYHRFQSSRAKLGRVAEYSVFLQTLFSISQ